MKINNKVYFGNKPIFLKINKKIKYSTYALFALLLILPETAMPEPFFRQVLPGYQYAFPKDHFSHPDFQTEWWYYTGHLKSEDGRRYGYELTFFRTGIESQRKRQSGSAWVMRDVYFSHFAITDENKKEFHFWEKINRKGPGLAGAEEGRLEVWNEGWRLDAAGDSHHIRAKKRGFGIDLLLTPAKPPVIHGENGISRKSRDPVHASHYYSLTRIETRGEILIYGKPSDVKGISWMDHEFFSHQTPEGLEGWDWFSIQLDNQTEIMLYQLRLKGGNIDPVSSGTFIGPDGETRHITSSGFSILPLNIWKSKESGAEYPSGWRIDIPGQGLSLRVIPSFKEQELITREATYWEGSCSVSGNYNGIPVTGVGYTELTGYAGSF